MRWSERCVVLAMSVVAMSAGIGCGGEEASSGTSRPQAEMGVSTPDQGRARDMAEDASLVPPEDLGVAGGEDAAPDEGNSIVDQGDVQDLSPLDMSEEADVGGADAGEDAGEDMATTPTLYVGQGDVFQRGALPITKGMATGAGGVRVQVWAPSQPGEYAVVVFQHGFLMSTSYYDTMLSQVASHGFVVAAPQMYAPGDNPIGKPKVAEEAASARAVWDGLSGALASALPAGVVARHDRRGLVGHSRGGKVIWLNMVADPSVAMALVGLDPVDGTGGPFGNEPRVVPESGFTFSAPVVVVGTGLGTQSIGFGGACAPTGDNHERFYAASRSPAYHLVATQHGHLDMLEDQPAGCGFTCQACVDGPERDTMRRASAGWIVALMRAVLQGDTTAYAILGDPSAAPLVASGESR